MKLRLDLLQHLKTEDVLEEALAQQSRYRPEPLFAQTGTGYLRPATAEEQAAEIARMKALQMRLKRRLDSSKGKPDHMKQMETGEERAKKAKRS